MSHMKMPKADTLDFLLQTDVIEEFLPNVGKKQWQVLHLTTEDNQHRFGMWSALLNKNAVENALKNDSWDLNRGEGKPGFSQSWPKGKEVTTYNRFGNDEGFRPLVNYRSFWGAFPAYLELAEEFRLYHDLAEDKERGLLLSFNESGREIEVVRIMPDKIDAQLKYLRQFQAGTGLYLAIYFDSMRFSNIPFETIPPYKRQLLDTNNLIRWQMSITKCNFPAFKKCKTFSRIFGKIILSPPELNNAGIWPFKNNETKAVSFIVDIDSEGNEIEHSSDPDKLGNSFGENPDGPHYLTPIFFRREVLSKYFAEPERYNVSDGRLRCLSLWSCQIDNDCESYIVVFLGDIGRNLPYEEQLHWRQFNFLPEGGISETNFRRSFLNQFADPQSPDLIFRRLYVTVNKNWEKVFGWPLFLLSSPGDEYLLDTVRIPVTNSQNEFDEQISHITKLVIDSLNEKEFEKILGTFDDSIKGIGKLDVFFAKTLFPQRETVIQLLRDIQSLRSAGSAHRKGSSYQKIITKLSISPKKKSDAVRQLLEKTIVTLSTLQSFYCGDTELAD